MCDWTKKQWRWIIHVSIRAKQQYNRIRREKEEKNINMSSIIIFEYLRSYSWIEPFKFQFKNIDFDFKVERLRCGCLFFYLDDFLFLNIFFYFQKVIKNLLHCPFYSHLLTRRLEIEIEFNKWIVLKQTVIGSSLIIEVNNCIKLEFMMFRLWKKKMKSCPKYHKYWDSTTFFLQSHEITGIIKFNGHK